MGDYFWHEENKSFKACPLALRVKSLRLLFNNDELKTFLFLNSSYRPATERFSSCTIPSTRTELHMSVRIVWVRLDWAGIVSWDGVSIAQSWLECTFPIFSIQCLMGSKQTLFVKHWHCLCTLQPQLGPLASSGETAVGIVNGLTSTYSEGMMKHSSRDSPVSERLLRWMSSFLLHCYPISQYHPFLLPLITITIISIGIIVLRKPINGALW